MNLRTMLAGDLFLVAGSSMPERLMGRVKTKSSLAVPRVMTLGCGQIRPRSYKKFYDYGNRDVNNISSAGYGYNDLRGFTCEGHG